LGTISTAMATMIAMTIATTTVITDKR